MSYNKFLPSKYKYNMINKLILKSSSFFNDNMDNIDFNPLKYKLLKALYIYTGYSNINIIGKSIIQFKNRKFEKKYFFLVQLFKNLFLIRKNKSLNVQLYFKFLKKKFLRRRRKKLNIKRESILLENFLKNFPFYYLKDFKNFLSNIFYILRLNTYKTEYKYKILMDSFNFIFDFFNSHFFKAFKFYKLFLNNIKKSSILKLIGIKIIIKGRFGKVRKQISKLVIGSLNLNTLINKVYYYQKFLITPRGSYGYHMWFSEKKKKFKG